MLQAEGGYFKTTFMGATVCRFPLYFYYTIFSPIVKCGQVAFPPVIC